MGMVVAVLGNHGECSLTWLGCEVDRIAEQRDGVSGTKKVTMHNQLLGMQSGLLLLLQQDNLKIRQQSM